MKTAVDRIGRGKARVVNARFDAMVSHYLFEATLCNPGSGWDKGQVEKNVQDARRRVWRDAPSFGSLAALNEWPEQRCLTLWHEVRYTEYGDRTVAQVWAQEQPQLMALPPPFDGFVEHTKRVSPTCLINFERDRYSVPSPFANRPVSLRVYAEHLVVVAEGVSKQHILNVLARLLEPALPAPLDTPAHLQLTDEPVADVNRYDRLREVNHAS